MNNSDLPTITDQDLARNPGVDMDLLRRLRELTRQMGGLGDDAEGSYRIEPALGGHLLPWPNRVIVTDNERYRFYFT